MLPDFCPLSTYVVAWTISSSPYVRSITGVPTAATRDEASSEASRPRLRARGQPVGCGEHFLDDCTDVGFGRPVIRDACTEADRAPNARVGQPDAARLIDLAEDRLVQLVQRVCVAAGPAETDRAQLDRGKQFERRLCI